jgi:hypothetical protein
VTARPPQNEARTAVLVAGEDSLLQDEHLAALLGQVVPASGARGTRADDDHIVRVVGGRPRERRVGGQHLAGLRRALDPHVQQHAKATTIQDVVNQLAALLLILQDRTEKEAPSAQENDSSFCITAALPEGLEQRGHRRHRNTPSNLLLVPTKSANKGTEKAAAGERQIPAESATVLARETAHGRKCDSRYVRSDILFDSLREPRLAEARPVWASGTVWQRKRAKLQVSYLKIAVLV